MPESCSTTLKIAGSPFWAPQKVQDRRNSKSSKIFVAPKGLTAPKGYYAIAKNGVSVRPSVRPSVRASVRVSHPVAARILKLEG
jgi:hypothetical protein